MKNILCVLPLLALVVFQACKTEELTPPVPTNNIVGFVNAQTEFGSPAAKDGFTVKIEGENGQVIATETTNADGRYELQNVPFGVYIITFDKQGYNTVKRSIRHNTPKPEPTNITATLMIAPSTTVVSDLRLTRRSDNTGFNIGQTLTPEGTSTRQRYSILFFSTTNDVSKDKYVVSQELIGALSSVTDSFLRSNFPVGASVYVAAYGQSITARTYTDLMTQRAVFYNINNTRSNVVEIVVQ
jgi:5-hydroxyisourate hydrolase-like protein (transthyretin family)